MNPVSDATRSDIDNVRSAPWRPEPGEPVVVYGAGGFARCVTEVLTSAGANVKHALDKRAPAVMCDNIPVYLPHLDPLPAKARGTTTAVIGVFNRAADPADMESALRTLGYHRIVHVPELYDSFASALGDRYWLAERAIYDAQRADVSAAASMWHDHESRELYRAVLHYRTRWSAADSPRPVEGVQYFPPDVPRTPGRMRFVDCGAYTGDTLESIASLGLDVDAAFVFEPDPQNFAKLTEIAGAFGRMNGATVALWPCAVTRETGMRRFRAAAGEASVLAPDGDFVVAGVALDDALPTDVVTDVKMDIEGAELDALRGAERLIRRSRPRLAVCVYHRPEHLWAVPLFVRDLGVPYDFFLRSHGYGGFDLVMYAVPRERRDGAKTLRVQS